MMLTAINFTDPYRSTQIRFRRGPATCAKWMRRMPVGQSDRMNCKPGLFVIDFCTNLAQRPQFFFNINLFAGVPSKITLPTSRIQSKKVSLAYSGYLICIMEDQSRIGCMNSVNHNNKDFCLAPELL